MHITKYETNLSNSRYLEETGSAEITDDLGNTESELIILYPEIKYQKIIGFGGAFTESSGYCFSKLSNEIKKQFLTDYFSHDGINYSLCRTHIGSCDFCLDTYSYSNNETLSDFSIERDKKYLIPLIKRAMELKPDIKLVATPWSPPAFMKDNNRLKQGGKLQEKYKNVWAKYLVKYFQEYHKQGINIDYMTVQNEPNASQPWESCQYTSKEELDLIKNYLYPTFKSNNIPIKLLIWDHNKERLIYRSMDILGDSRVRDMVAGVGYHYYSGDHFENIKTFSELYDDKLVIHTEGCTGYEKSWFRKKKRRIPNAEIYAHDIMGDLNSGANGYIDWNILLDYYGGPTHVNNSCNAPIMLNKKSNNYTKTLSYYYIGHFSKFIKPGAKRIAFSKYTDELEVTSFCNTDNSIVTVVLNRSEHRKEFRLCINKKVHTDTIDRHSIKTYIIT